LSQSLGLAVDEILVFLIAVTIESLLIFLFVNERTVANTNNRLLDPHSDGCVSKENCGGKN